MLTRLKSICKEAGDAILQIYGDESKFNVVDFKADDSPLTLADQAAHQVIEAALKEAYPVIPILSEEGKHTAFEERKTWDRFWCVDPLDGTKEFIKRNGEFTVNIALIENGFPVLGIIYAPVPVKYFIGGEQIGKALVIDAKGERPIRIANNNSDERTAVRSRSHASVEEEEVLQSYNAHNYVSVGSSLKFCMVAEGKADLYFRQGPTMEWDTAAGQAIVEGAGGKVLRLDEKDRRFYYNKEELLNPGFLCLGF